MLMDAKLKDKVTLITGVGGGIGRAFLDHLKGKVKVLISASRSSEGEISGDTQSTSNLRHYSLDLTDEMNVKNLMMKITDDFGQLDIVINTIGGSLYSHKIEAFPLNEFHEVINLNLTTAFLLTRETILSMKDNKMGGHIVHIVSAAAKKISKNKAPYGIAKAGLVKLIGYAATETADYNIKINGITPAYVFTPRHEHEIEKKSHETGIDVGELINQKMNSQLLKKPIYPKDLIPLLDLLITTEAITGQVFNCTMGKILTY